LAIFGNRDIKEEEVHTMQSVDTAQTIRNAAKFSGGFAISRLLGLARDILLAYVLGGGWVADIFLAAFRIPNFARRVFYEGAMYMPFLPLFNRLYHNHSRAEAFAFGRAALFRLLMLTLVLALLCKYASYAIALLLVPGFAAQSGMITMAGNLMEITFFYLPFVAVATILACMALAFEHYIAASITPACLNLTIIFSGLYAYFGGYSGYDAARIFCYGVLAGGILQSLVQLPALYKEGFRFFGSMALRSSEAKAFSRHAPQAIFGAASYQVGAVLAMLIASFLGEGNVSALYFAERILEIPLALVGIALCTANLNSFSILVLQERKQELTLSLRQLLSLGLCFSLPATFGLIALASPIINSFFGYGSFKLSTLEHTITALTFYAPVLPAMVLSRPLLAVLNAGGKTFGTVAVALISLGLLTGLSFLLSDFWGLKAITISAGIAAWVSTLALMSLLLRSGICERGVCIFPWKSCACYLVFSSIMFAVLLLFLHWAEYTGLSSLSRMLIGVPLGIILFFSLCRLCYRQDVDLIYKALLSKE
jgi:putative peptidoglycan lipid II flippase